METFLFSGFAPAMFLDTFYQFELKLVVIILALQVSTEKRLVCLTIQNMIGSSNLYTIITPRGSP